MTNTNKDSARVEKGKPIGEQKQGAGTGGGQPAREKRSDQFKEGGKKIQVENVRKGKDK